MFCTIWLNVGVMNVLYNFIKCGGYECSMQFYWMWELWMFCTIFLNVGIMNVLYNFIKCGGYECSMQFY
jgi:hypothetical protein